MSLCLSHSSLESKNENHTQQRFMCCYRCNRPRLIMRALNYSLILRVITARFLKCSRLPAFSHPHPRDGQRWSHGGRCPHVLLPGWRWCVSPLSPAVVNAFFRLIGVGMCCHCRAARFCCRHRYFWLRTLFVLLYCNRRWSFC